MTPEQVAIFKAMAPARKLELAAEFSPCFATDGVKAAYQSLKAAGVRIVGEYQEFGPQFAFFRVSDPDGNLIEIAGAP